MSIETTHVIKRDDVAASRAVRPHPSVLLDTLKIPSEHVRMAGEGEESERDRSAQKRRGRIKEPKFAEEAFEVFTRAPVQPPAPKPNEKEEEEEPTPEEIEARWEQRLEDAVAAAHEEGVEAGRAAVREEAQAEIENAKTEFARDVDGIQAAWEEHLENSQIRLVELAFRIARAVLDAPLPSDVRRVSESALSDAIDHMVDSAPVEVVLHPVSYLHIQEAGLEEQLRALHSKLRFRSDPDLKENEWIVQSDRSTIRRLEAELLDQLQRELSLRDAGPDHDRTAGASGSDEHTRGEGRAEN